MKNPITATGTHIVNPDAVPVNPATRLQERRDNFKATRTANKGKRKVWTHYQLSPVYADTCDCITETAIAYLDKASRIMAYTAIKTAYVNSGHPYLYQLMLSAHADREIQGQVALAHDVSTTRNSEYRKLLGIDDDSETMQELKYHRDGMPYLSTTDTGKAHMKATANTVVHADYSDCVSIAFLAIWERIDTFETWADVWQIRRYVYREVNKYLHEQRKGQSEQERFSQYVIFTDNDGNEIERTTGQADKAISAVMDNNAFDSIIKFVCSRVRKDAREGMQIVLACRLSGMTTRQIATVRGHKSDRNTVRMMERAREILSTPDGKAFLSSLID